MTVIQGQDVLDVEKQKLIKFFQGNHKTNPDATQSFLYLARKNQPAFILKSAVCHASFKDVSNGILLGSGFFVSEKRKSAGEKFWNWISDPNKSPWKKLLVNGIELIKVVDLPCGWILPEKTLKEIPFEFIKNFCILTRVFSEKHFHLQVWEKFVDRGMNEAEAFHLCGFVSTNLMNPKDEKITSYPYSMQGGHWPLTDALFKGVHFDQKTNTYGDNYRILDLKKFKNGEPDFSITYDERVSGGADRINRFFSIPESKRMPFDVLQYCPNITQQTKFSKAAGSFTIDGVIEGYYKWKDEAGIE